MPSLLARSRPLGVVVLAAAAALAFARPAWADDLIVTVERTASTSQRPALTVRATQGGPVEVTVRRLNRPDFVAGLGVDVARPEGVLAALAAYGKEVETRNADLLPVVRRSLPAPSAGTLRRSDFDPLAAGLYVVEAEQVGIKARALLLVSDLALVTKRDERGLLAWAVDRTRGTPKAGVGVRVQRGRDVLAQASTDARGLARLAGTFPPDAHLVAEDGDHLAFGSERWFAPRAAGLRVYLMTHQPAYRPGERVEVRGIARATDAEGRAVLAPGVARATLRFVAAGPRVLGEIEVAVSPDLGTFAGGFTLPADAPTGAGEVRAEIDGDVHAGPLVVDAYRRPPFEVEVTAAAPRVLAGQEAAFTVRARGYDGALLPKAPVTWALLFHRVERDLFPADELARLFFGSEREAFAPVTLFEGSGTLDEQATLAVTRATQATLGEGYVTLRATVVGPDGMHVVGSGVCGVSAAPLTVALKTDRHLYGPEDVMRVSVRAQQADGTPAAARPGVLTLARDEARGRAGAAEQVWLENRPFTTDARGEAQVELSLREAARYVVLAAVERAAGDPAGPPAAASLGVWCAGETTTLGYAGERLDLIADKDDYAPGETARVLVLSPLGARPLLATVEGATLLDAQLLSPEGTTALWTLALDEGHAPNVWLACLGVDQGNAVTGQRMLRLPPRSRLLTTEIAPDAAEVAPGATSGARIAVRDARGAPVAGAEVSLAVVDEALHALFPDPAAAVEAFFHPPRRNGVKTGGPLHLASVGHAQRVRPREERAELGRQGPGGVLPPSAPAPAPSAMPPPGAAPEPSPAGPPAERPQADPNAPAGEDGGTSAGFGGLEESAKKLEDDAGPPTATTRADFRTAIHWSPALRTGPDGSVRVEDVRYADTLTRWRLSALAVDAQTRVGTARATVRTKRNIAVEVTAPRFLRVGDSAAAPVVVSNLTSEPLEITAWAAWSTGPGEPTSRRSTVTHVDPGVAMRHSTLGLKADQPGTLTLHAGAHSVAHADRLRRELPVLPQGIEVRHVAYVEGTGKPMPSERLALALALPRDVEPGTRRATLRMESTLLQAALAALPALIDYPYGCTEQTLSRFEPLLVVAETVEELDLTPDGVLVRMPELVGLGVERLAQLQGPDGGFGWWPGEGLHPEMTARALRALVRARDLDVEGAGLEGVAERAGAMVERAAAALARRWASLDPADAPSAALVLAALAEAGALPEGALEQALDTLGAERAAPLTRALFLQAALAAQRAELVGPLVAGLVASAVETGRGLHFGVGRGGEGGVPERWQDDAIESTAVVLRALFAAGMKGDTLGEGARWLLQQRVNGDSWRSTRDTAAAVSFLAPYGVMQKRSAGQVNYKVLAEGRLVLSLLAGSDMLLDSTQPTIELPAALLGGERVALEVEGPGGFGATLIVKGWATGPAIAGREHGLKVVRRWFRLDPQPADSGVVYVRTPVTETVPAGTVLECEIEVTSDRAREFVQITDPHAAGFEPEREVGLNVKGRVPALACEVQGYDDRTEFFVTSLPAGTHVVRHLVRATHVGAFTALPAQARLMYFPEVGGSSEGEQLEVSAPPPAAAAGGGR